MADKPFYRTEYRLQRIGGDDKEFLVVDFQLEDELNEGYHLKVHCTIPDALQEQMAAACGSRRGVDVEFFMRRQFPDGELLETRIAGLVHSMERSQEGDPELGRFNDEFLVTIVPAWELLKNEQTGGTWHKRSYADILFEMLQEGLSPFGRSVDRW